MKCDDDEVDNNNNNMFPPTIPGIYWHLKNEVQNGHIIATLIFNRNKLP